ncbi:hypothetical protein ACFYT4_34715 [Streptomyces sp. NPDC004609]|uniref:hypothetical protein n=1 Tax=Streptomyces sp. NPDC004609 TaxID=3364704 RepID=UPI00369184D3
MTMTTTPDDPYDSGTDDDNDDDASTEALMHGRTGEDVLRDVVSRLAPEELAKLDEARRRYAERPYPPQRPSRSGGSVLASGVETAVLMPLLIAFVAQFLADVAADGVKRGGRAWARRRQRRRRRREATEERRTALTAGVPDATAFPRDELLRWAAEQARDCGVSRTDAEQYAQVVVVAVIGTPAPDDGPAAPPAPGGGDGGPVPATPDDD